MPATAALGHPTVAGTRFLRPSPLPAGLPVQELESELELDQTRYCRVGVSTRTTTYSPTTTLVAVKDSKVAFDKNGIKRQSKSAHLKREGDSEME